MKRRPYDSGGSTPSSFQAIQYGLLSTILIATTTQTSAQNELNYPNNLFTTNNRTIVTNQAMGARCAVSADFDGDGLQDLVSASSNDNAVSWYRNLGGHPPTFSIKNEITWSSLGSRIVTVGDVGRFCFYVEG